MFRPAISKLAATLALISLVACHGKTTARRMAGEEAAPNELVLVATTDFHSALERAEGLANVLGDLRKQYGDHVLYLDGGDLFQGSLEGNMSKGHSIVEFFNFVKLDAAAIGNHDLDYGVDMIGRINPNPGEDGLGNLKARIKESKFKWLSANFVSKKTGRPLFAPHAVFERAGMRACVIGATTPFTANITNPSFIKHERFASIEKTVAAEASRLRKKERCDWVVLTAHAGLLCNETGRCQEEGDYAEILRLLRTIPRGTLDAVVAGHTHKRAQEVINGTPVIEAETGAKVVGVLKLKKGAEPRFEPFIPVPAQATNKDVTELLKPYRDEAVQKKNTFVGTTSAAFVREYHSENPLGNLIADALRQAGTEAGNAEFALVNAGGLRGDFPKGEVLYDHVFKAMPFDNSLSIVELTGAELKRLLEIALSGGHGMAAVSGLKIKRLAVGPGESGSFSRDLNNDGKKEDWERALLVEVADSKGVPIQDTKTYRLATLDFLVLGGDHERYVYDSVPAARKQMFAGVWIRDIVTEHFKKYGELSPESYFDPKRPRVELVKP